MRTLLRRAFKRNGRAGAVLIATWVLALVVGGYLVANERFHPPSWMPIVGQNDFYLNARVKSVAGVLPGQGQAVDIAGVTVGQISAVKLVNGLAVATLRIDPKYGDRIYPDASVLLRPKTGLKDMIAELDPGTRSAGPALHSGATLGSQSTKPTVDLDEILAMLDADTRQELLMLIGAGSQALGHGGGHDLANTFRDFAPLSRDVKKAAGLVSTRRRKLARLMGNLSKIATELGGRDRELVRFVHGSEGSFRAFANQNEKLSQMIDLLPKALRVSDTALQKVGKLGDTLGETSRELDPMARALGPSLQQLQKFEKQTTPVIHDELRPFSREAQPTVGLLVPAARDLAAATPGLRVFANALDAFGNELAYDPPGNGKGKQSPYFYALWSGHDTNSALANQDGIGPVARGLVALTCGNLNGLDIFLKIPTGRTEPYNPPITTLLELLHTPDHAQLIEQGRCPKPAGYVPPTFNSNGTATTSAGSGSTATAASIATLSAKPPKGDGT